MQSLGRFSILTVLVALTQVGLATPVHAGGDDPAPVTLNGRSLERGSLFEVVHGPIPVVWAPDPAASKSTGQANWWRRRSVAARGAIIGAGAGAAMGLGAGVAYCVNDGPGVNCGGRVESGFALIYAGLGAGVGALIGALLE